MEETLTVAHAADALGVSKPVIYGMIHSGVLTASAGPRGQLVSRSEVMTVASKRRVDAVRRHRDLIGFARQVRLTIWPPEPETVILSDGREQTRDPADVVRYMSTPKGRDALHRLDTDAVAVFGPAVIHTLADAKSLKAAGACLWCWARGLAAVHGGVSPSDSAAVRELIGEPCPKDLAKTRTNGDVIDRLWREAKTDDRRRREEAQREARRHEHEAARADVERATRRLAKAVTASGFSLAGEAARYRQEARRDRAAGDEVMARHMEAVAAKIERSAS